MEHGDDSMSKMETLLRHLEKEIKIQQKSHVKQQKIIDELTHKIETLELQINKTESTKSTLKNILESAIEYSIVSIDLNGLILMWNEGARRNYGYTAEEMEGKQTISLLHFPEDIKNNVVKKFLAKAYKEGKADAVFERRRKDKTRFTASVSISMRRDSKGKPVGYVIISKDITQAKILEERLLKSNEELEQFAYITSHDLKAPLRAIDSLASWIEEDNADALDEKSKANLALLRQRTHRMANLIDGILQYSRAGRSELDIDTVDTKKMLQEVIDSLNPQKFSIEYPKKLPVFQTAKIPFSQIFSNLISNSIKHHHQQQGTIKIKARTLKNFYEFSVSDDGPGIDPEYFDKIFQVFQTLKSRDELESTGIGLSIVKKIIESLGGKIVVKSAKGKGTTFCFTWPKKFNKNT